LPCGRGSYYDAPRLLQVAAAERNPLTMIIALLTELGVALVADNSSDKTLLARMQTSPQRLRP